MEATKQYYLIIGLMVSIFGTSVLLKYYPVWFDSTNITPSRNSSLPHLTPSFVGRQREINELGELLKYSSSGTRILGITGAPGFGKTTLAIYMGHKLKNEGIDVIYVDMDEIATLDTFAYKVLAISQASRENITIQDLYQWGKILGHETLLILDNCDKLFHTNKDGLQKVITGLVEQSSYKSLKILTTSRRQVMYTKQFKIFVVGELDHLHSHKLLMGAIQPSDNLDSAVCSDIASLIGGVPLALHVVGALLNMPDSPKPQQILMQLKGTLSPEDLQIEDRVNASIYLSYQYLETDIKKMGQYISHFPGSFSDGAAFEVLSSVFPDEKIASGGLQALVRRSLIDHHAGRYVYHTLIQEFFKNLSTPEDVKKFNLHFLEHYASVLRGIAQKDVASQAIFDFYYEKHNFEHFFEALSNLKLSKKAKEIFMELSDILGKLAKIKGMNNYNIQEYLNTLLSHLKQNTDQLIKAFGKKKFVTVYSRVVMLALMAEQPFMVDTHVLIKKMEEHEWLFMKYQELIRDKQYIQFYHVLAGYHADVNDDKKAKKCHEKVLKREKVLVDCHGEECSNLHLAKAFLSSNDFKSSARYCDKALPI